MFGPGFFGVGFFGRGFWGGAVSIIPVIIPRVLGVYRAGRRNRR